MKKAKDPEAATFAYTADALIVATGASARTLGIEKEMHWMGYGLGTCATCDGALYRNRHRGQRKEDDARGPCQISRDLVPAE